jgi:hypothetical protein
MKTHYTCQITNLIEKKNTKYVVPHIPSLSQGISQALTSLLLRKSQVANRGTTVFSPPLIF